jgi:hypothetical protein
MATRQLRGLHFVDETVLEERAKVIISFIIFISLSAWNN